MLNDVFVSSLHGLVGLPIHLHWSRSLQYALVLFVSAFCFSDF